MEGEREEGRERKGTHSGGQEIAFCPHYKIDYHF